MFVGGKGGSLLIDDLVVDAKPEPVEAENYRSIAKAERNTRMIKSPI